MERITKERAASILKNCNGLSNDLNEENWYDIVTCNLEEGIENCTGASKGVLIMEDEDEVIKIPFTGEYYSHREYDEDTGDYEDEDYTENFYLAGSETPGYDGENWDYCEVEEYLYDSAVNFGISELFAQTRSLGTFAGHPIYAQEKCVTFDELDESSPVSSKVKTHTKEDKEETNDLISSHHLRTFGLNTGWLTSVRETYGNFKLFLLLQFIRIYHIMDLHHGNYGYDMEGRPIIIDYAGFCD